MAQNAPILMWARLFEMKNYNMNFCSFALELKMFICLSWNKDFVIILLIKTLSLL